MSTLTKIELRENAIKPERLKEVLDYSTETGLFTWKINAGRCIKGRATSYITHNGYKKIKVDKKSYVAHRLAWLYVYNKFPNGDIDHIDGDRLNNKISNLREASRSQNLQNKKMQSNNSSGYIGVSYDKKRNKWDARISVFGKQICLGLFITAEEASRAYEEKALEYFKEFKFNR